MNGRTINAEKGGYFLEVTTAHTSLRGRALVINTAATFTTLTITDGTTSYSALAAKSAGNPYGQNLASASVSAGIVLYAPEGFYFSAATMSSGTAYLINI